MELYNNLLSNEESLALVGLGYVGMPIAHAFAKKGLNVIGFDLNSREPDEDYYQKDKELYREQITLEGLSPYEPLLKSLAKDAGIREVVFRYNDEVEIIRTIESIPVNHNLCQLQKKEPRGKLRLHLSRMTTTHSKPEVHHELS